MKKFLGTFVLVAITAVTMTPQVHADTIRWDQIQPDYQHYSIFTGTTVDGVGFTVTDAGGSFEARTQPDSWLGTFAPSTHLLWTSGVGPVDISFATEISSFSTQIQSNYYGNYSAYMTAFDSLSQVVGYSSVNGVSAFNPGTVPEFTVTGTGIASIEIGLTSAPYGSVGDFSIAAVPEPSSFALLALGGVGLAFGAYRSRRYAAI